MLLVSLIREWGKGAGRSFKVMEGQRSKVLLLVTTVKEAATAGGWRDGGDT